MSIADDILAKQDRPMEKVHVPQWDMDVWIKTMSGKERDRWEGEISMDKKEAGTEGKPQLEDYDNLRARLAVRTICDESGKLIFETSQAGELGEKSAGALSMIFDVAARLNGITKTDMDDLEKK